MAHLLDPPPTLAEPCPVRTALGDPDTVRKILTSTRIYLGRVKTYPTRSGLERDAEDFAAEAQAAALAKASSFDPARNGGVAGWIHGFVRNIAKRAFAKVRKHRADPSVDSLPDKTEAVADRFLREADREGVQRALVSLSALDRRILELRFFDGLPFEEIARIVGLTAVNVRVKTDRAKKELFQLLSPTLRGGPS